MRIRYDKEDDALMIWFSREAVDFAEQKKDVIAHFSKKNKLALLEILEASKFLKEASDVFPPNIKQRVFAGA